jgi:hypothetical protein
MNYTQHATTLKTSLKGFLFMATHAPARRQHAAQELSHVLQEAEAAVSRPETTDPGYAQLLVNIGVAKQKLQRYGV